MLLSADGSTVVYRSSSAQLVEGQIDSSHSDDVFAYDRSTGATTLVSHTTASLLTASGRSSLDSFPKSPKRTAKANVPACCASHDNVIVNFILTISREAERRPTRPDARALAVVDAR